MQTEMTKTWEVGTRDFVGYGLDIPKIEWPNGARLALTFAINYEAGGERSVIYGDSGPEAYGEFPSYSTPPNRDLAMESLFEYEGRVGIWRLLNLFDSYGVKVTFFATAKTLEANLIAAKEIVRRGHEICSHGYRWVEHYTLSKEEEREAIKKAVKVIRDLTGTRPVGWYCREPSTNTIPLLMEEGGFLYDSDIYNDDLPYFAESEDKRSKLLLIPYTPDVNDFHYLSGRFANAEEFFTYLKDSLDVMYDESLSHPKIMNVGVHVRISGRAGRSAALSRFLKYAMEKKDVWIATRVDIANWWLKNYPD
jgi:peptidoglycan/xylan/chitin deacetylase (PgdA/CDA1 family)